MDGSVTTFIEESGNYPDGIIIVGSTVYWTTMGLPTPDSTVPSGSNFRIANGSLRASSLDGKNTRIIIPDGSITTGKQLTSDGNDRLYWGDREGCKVSSSLLDGSKRIDHVVNHMDDGTSWLDECVGVAVDPRGGYLYWTQKGPSKAAKGRILRAPLRLDAESNPVAASEIEVLWEGLPEPIDLELLGDTLYWTDRGAPPEGNTLNRAQIPKSGEKGAPPEILASNFHEAIGLTISPDRKVYVSDLSGEIREIQLDAPAGKRERIVASLGVPLTGITLI